MTKSVLPFTIGALALGGIAAAAYVLFVATSDPSAQDGYARFATGDLERLAVLDEPPAQPDTIFLNEERERVTLEQFHGKVTLVNLWATWCAPCVKEMPSLDRLNATLGSDQFEVIAVSLDRSMSDARAWYDDNDIASLGLYQESSTTIAQALDSPGVPITVLYDPQGRELARLTSDAEWDSPAAMALIEAAVAEAFAEPDAGA